MTSLKPLQGNLKTLKKTEYEKLKKSLITRGITFPAFVWKEGDTNWIVDGHQRVFTLQKLLAEGYGIPSKIPVVFVKAASVDEAKELVLLASSAYAKIEADGLSEFLDSFGELDWEFLKSTIDLPDLDMDQFQDGYMGDPVDSIEGVEEEQAPTHVKLTLLVHNDDYTSFRNQFDELLKKFPRLLVKGEDERE